MSDVKSNDDHNSLSANESNLNGDYHDARPRTPERGIIALDMLHNADDLKKDATVAKSENSEDGDVISKFIGHYGRWQFVWTFLVTLFQIAPTVQIFGFTFQTAVKDFWCARPDNAPNMDVTLWRNLSQPEGACSILNLNYSRLPDLPLADIGSDQLIPCTKFEFFSEETGARSLIEEFDLVCSRQDLIFLMEMSALAGAAIGGITSGLLSDRFGRKHIMMVAVLVQAIAGTLVVYSINTAMFMSLRAITGFVATTISTTSVVLVIELVSGKWRYLISILSILSMPFSYIVIACIAYFVRDWRNLQLILSLPFLSFLLIWYCMPESPRWLLEQGRLKDLCSLIERAARVNHRTLPANYPKTLEAAVPSIESKYTQTNLSSEQTEGATSNCGAINPNANGANPTVHDNPLKVVFNRYYWRTTCLNVISWMSLMIIYFGLSLHIGNLGGDIYLNTAVGGAVEIVSVILSIFVVLKVGMKRSVIGYTLVPGVLCLATNVLPSRDENGVPVIVMAILAKCIIGANNAILPSYSAMQYPTIVRNFGMGIGNLASGIALVLVPYVWKLEQIDQLLPMSVMGVCGIIGTISLYLMRDVEKQKN